MAEKKNGFILFSLGTVGAYALLTSVLLGANARTFDNRNLILEHKSESIELIARNQENIGNLKDGLEDVKEGIEKIEDKLDKLLRKENLSSAYR